MRTQVCSAQATQKHTSGCSKTRKSLTLRRAIFKNSSPKSSTASRKSTSKPRRKTKQSKYSCVTSLQFGTFSRSCTEISAPCRSESLNFSAIATPWTRAIFSCGTRGICGTHSSARSILRRTGKFAQPPFRSKISSATCFITHQFRSSQTIYS